jgi:hypothetical protein
VAANFRTRWTRVARRAAEIQAFVLMTILYWAIVVPIGMARKALGTRAAATGWKARTPGGDVPIEDARRQS